MTDKVDSSEALPEEQYLLVKPGLHTLAEDASAPITTMRLFGPKAWDSQHARRVLQRTHFSFKLNGKVVAGGRASSFTAELPLTLRKGDNLHLGLLARDGLRQIEADELRLILVVESAQSKKAEVASCLTEQKSMSPSTT
jgi:hypothetical protein